MIGFIHLNPMVLYFCLLLAIEMANLLEILELVGIGQPRKISELKHIA